MPRWLALMIAGCAATSHAVEFDARFKAFGVQSYFPNHDLQRELDGTPASDGDFDLRLMFTEQRGSWRFLVHHSTIYQVGDSFQFNQTPQNTLDQTPRDDDRRFLDLTWTLDDGADHRLYHRFDRLAATYRGDRWSVTFGRDAVSWGSGKVFQPMDVFAPFAPTTVDRDYKTGEDLVKVDALLHGGGDIQLLAVLRRDDEENRDVDESSIGAKWRSFVGESEIELVGGRHFEDLIAGFSFRHPLGGALLQTDWLATRLDDEDKWVVSGVVNLDYSFTVAQKNAYVFGEYYRNGFGRNDKPVDIFDLPEALIVRLQRGEVFNFMKDYTAFGGSIEWHPLVRQNLTLISNLHDHSSLVQMQLSYDPSDQQRLEIGVTEPLGDEGDEYGGIRVLGDLTRGGQTQLYLRWVYYF